MKSKHYDWLLDKWRRFVCKVIGHIPRGPIAIKFRESEFPYKCDRCDRIIYFDPDRGWKPK